MDQFQLHNDIHFLLQRSLTLGVMVWKMRRKTQRESRLVLLITGATTLSDARNQRKGNRPEQKLVDQIRDMRL
jgi:hypothetical protein